MNEPAKGPESLEGFDLEALRLTTDFETITTKKILNVVPVRKPKAQEFFRSLRGDEWVFQTSILDLKAESQEIYLVHPNLVPDLEQELRQVALYSAYNRQGNYFLVPVMLPKEGRQNSWHESLQQAVIAARDAWVRAVPNQGISGYDLVVAQGAIREPQLPEVSGIKDLITIAFRDRWINSFDHPVLKQLRGEA